MKRKGRTEDPLFFQKGVVFSGDPLPAGLSLPFRDHPPFETQIMLPHFFESPELATPRGRKSPLP